MRALILYILLAFVCVDLSAQSVDSVKTKTSSSESYTVAVDSVSAVDFEEVNQKVEAETVVELDTVGTEVHLLTASDVETPSQAIDTKRWIPDPKKALWLAIVFPGAGQIYNRKYWKLPLVYGGFLGCIYAMSWNNSQYKDYAQAYLDLSDNDPSTASYNKFLHLGVEITDGNKQRYLDIFRKRKDKYRRWRDLSFFVMCGVYALSVIDAYVDAELSVFDISKDLSLKVEPTIINTHLSNNPFDSSSIGLQCSVNF